MGKRGIILIVLAVCCSTGLMAQQGLLWKVSKPGSKKVSYLFGTMHTSDSLCNTWSDAWWKAFDDCDMLAGEADFGDYSQAIQALTLSMMKDTVLSDLYSPEEYAFVDSIMVAHGQEGMKYLHRKMRPLVSMLTYLETPESTGPFTELMDLRLQHMAVERGWQVAGLETAVEQLECLQVLSLEEEADMLLDVLSTADSSQNFLDDLTGTYLTQDLQKLAEDESMADYPPRLMHAILDVRNQRFLERLIPMMKKQRVFCAVGALHLYGPTGLIEGLKSKGFLVEAVPFTFSVPNLYPYSGQ